MLSGRQRGRVSGMVWFGVAVAIVIVALSRGCDEEPATAGLPVSVPAAAPATAAAGPPPAPATVSQAAEAAPPAPAAASGKPALVVHNPCDQPLHMAVSAVDAEGRRRSGGFFQVAPGARIVPAPRSGPIHLHDKTIHYYTETLASEPVEQGRREEIVGDRQLAMKQVELDPPAGTTITLECPGATSGRP